MSLPNNHTSFPSIRQNPVSSRPPHYLTKTQIPQYRNQYIRNEIMPIPPPMNYQYSPYEYGYHPPFTAQTYPLYLAYTVQKYRQMIQERCQYQQMKHPQSKKQKSKQHPQIIEILSDQSEQLKNQKQKPMQQSKKKEQQKIPRYIKKQIPRIPNDKKVEKKQIATQLIKTKRIHKVKIKSDLPGRLCLQKAFKRDKMPKKKQIKHEKTQKNDSIQKKKSKIKNQQRSHRELMRYQDSHGKIRIGKDFQTNIPQFISSSSCNTHIIKNYQY